jgi:hypothetical protein
MFFMFVLILADGFILCWCWCLEIESSYIDLAQLSRFHLKAETKSSLRNAVCLKKTKKKKQDVGLCTET